MNIDYVKCEGCGDPIRGVDCIGQLGDRLCFNCFLTEVKMRREDADERV